MDGDPKACTEIVLNTIGILQRGRGRERLSLPSDTNLYVEFHIVYLPTRYFREAE